jgi:CRP-like cAMP-binding protein
MGGRMPRSIHRAEERALIGRLLIDLLKTIHRARRQLSDKSRPHLTGDLEYVLLSYAVLIGGLSGRPKNATEIGRYIDIPRATAQRKLGDLEKSGVVVRKGSKYHMTGAKMGPDEYIDKCLLLIKRAAQSM